MLRIEAAGVGDVEPLGALLVSAGLPTEGLRDHLGTALVARDGGVVVGCVALEVYGDAALLRSLAVTPSRQGEGLGRRLTRSALELGRETGVKTFCLLTIATVSNPRCGCSPTPRRSVVGANSMGPA
jgi:amino-acid N-acetyltransferase